MKLEKILQGLTDLKLRGDLNTEISGIEKNSKTVIKLTIIELKETTYNEKI